MTPNSNGREICIAVVGSADVGKSTFIQKAYDLKVPPNQNSMASKSLLVDKLMCDVKLVEVDIEKMDLESQPLIWPKVDINQSHPHCFWLMIDANNSFPTDSDLHSLMGY